MPNFHLHAIKTKEPHKVHPASPVRSGKRNGFKRPSDRLLKSKPLDSAMKINTFTTRITVEMNGK